MGQLADIAAVFLKIGTIGFGGPAAHIALMQRELVERRGWLTQQEYLDAVGAANLIPGPTSTELALYIGWLRARAAGLLVAGACFIAPAAVLTLAFAVLYVRYGQLPAVQPVLHGIQAAVIGIIAAAGWQLTKSAARTLPLFFIGVLVVAAAAAGLGEIWALVLGGVSALAFARVRAAKTPVAGFVIAAMLMPRSVFAAAAVGKGAMGAAGTTTLAKLALYFLTIGSVLYGSGYVLIAFLEGWLVNDAHLITRQQLLDAVAVGQFTPGPVSTTATFIGYLVHGTPGALVCTIAIFLPSFVLVALLGRYVARLRNSRNMAHFLDGVNVGSVGLIFLVSARLAQANLTSWRAGLIALVSLALLVTVRLNPTWLVLAGGIAGYLWLR